MNVKPGMSMVGDIILGSPEPVDITHSPNIGMGLVELNELSGMYGPFGLVGGAAIAYLLRDEFITDRAVGAVNGTLAEPGPGTRVVVDTGNNISLLSGYVQFAGGVSMYTDTYLRYSAVIRVPGQFVKVSVNRINAFVGLVGLSAASNDPRRGGVSLNGGGSLAIINENFVSIVVGPALLTGQHGFCKVLRAIGAYYFVKSATYTAWAMLWFDSVSNAASMYPIIGNFVNPGANAMDYIRIPDVIWLPTPVAYDTFTRANGALGSSETTGPDSQAVMARAWTGATWAIDTNQAQNTPTEGAESVTNGDFSAWTADDPDNWTVTEDGVNTEISEVGVGQGHGGAGVGLCNLWRNGGGGVSDPSIVQDITTVGTWNVYSIYVDTVTAGSLQVHDTPAGAGIDLLINSTGIKTGTYRAHNKNLRFRNVSDPGDITIDDVSVKELTLSTLFSSLTDATTADVLISDDVTLTTNTQAGIVMNLDSAGSPANFIIAYHDGTNAVLEKCVAGVYTGVISAVAAYAAGATLVVIKDGTSYALYYNNVKIGATSTVNDAGIIDNTIHGLFSTYSANRLDNFTLMARGTGGEYAELDDF